MLNRQQGDARGIRERMRLGRERGVDGGQDEQDEPQRDEPGPRLAPAVEEDGDERRQERREDHAARVDEPAEKVVQRDRPDEDDERLLKAEPFEVARDRGRRSRWRPSGPDRPPAPARRTARRGCRTRPPGTGRPAPSPGRRPAAAASCGASRRRRPAPRRTTPDASTGVQDRAARLSSIVSVASIHTSVRQWPSFRCMGRLMMAPPRSGCQCGQCGSGRVIVRARPSARSGHSRSPTPRTPVSTAMTALRTCTSRTIRRPECSRTARSHSSASPSWWL